MGTDNRMLEERWDEYKPSITEEGRLMFYAPNKGEYILESDIQYLSESDQYELMRAWFLSEYADPQEEMPYDSEDKQYVFLYGGPYTAQDELDTFVDYVPETVISELAHELDGECYQWTRRQPPEDFFDDHYDYEGITPQSSYTAFIDELTNTKGLLSEVQKMDTVHRTKLFHMIYANLITITEVYLQNTLITDIQNQDNKLKKVIKKADRKINLFDTTEKSFSYKTTALEYLDNIAWHNLGTVTPLYKAIDIKLPDTKSLKESIEVRHDIVHRNGSTKKKEPIVVSEDTIIELIDTLADFGKELNHKLISRGGSDDSRKTF